MSGRHETQPRVEVGLRRVAELDPAAPLPESDPRLVERIAEEIRRHGPISFATFMELALYDPEAGYYTADRAGELTAGPGRAGDFLTAPEGHPIFGWAIARHLESVWVVLDRPARFVVREHGAGTGALAAAILEGLQRSRSPLLEAIRYQPVDVSAARLGRLGERVAGLGLADRLEPFDASAEVGAILANELLDALPVHRVEGGPDGSLLERFVTVAADGSFTTTLAPSSTPALAARLESDGVRLEPGQAAEVCLAVDRWVRDAAASLERGELLVVDYGDEAAELYRAGRGSTLRAYHRHRVHADPFVAIGRQDLTAHVDLTALARAATAAGLVEIGRTSQARFLAALDAGELLVGLQTDPAIDLGLYLEARAALVRMVDPRVTGGFTVLAFGRQLAAGGIRGFG
jgi:SAM-dependent MidA family methyltransferase